MLMFENTAALVPDLDKAEPVSPDVVQEIEQDIGVDLYGCRPIKSGLSAALSAGCLSPGLLSRMSPYSIDVVDGQLGELSLTDIASMAGVYTKSQPHHPEPAVMVVPPLPPIAPAEDILAITTAINAINANNANTPSWKSIAAAAPTRSLFRKALGPATFGSKPLTVADAASYRLSSRTPSSGPPSSFCRTVEDGGHASKRMESLHDECPKCHA